MTKKQSDGDYLRELAAGLRPSMGSIQPSVKTGIERLARMARRLDRLDKMEAIEKEHCRERSAD